MEYEINIGGELYPLKPYTMEIAEKLEKQELLDRTDTKFKDKVKGKYNLLVLLIGKDAVEKEIGTFEKSDPNKVNIVYLEMIRAYNQPLADYQMEKTNDSLNNLDVDKITGLLEAMVKANSIKVVK